MSFYSVMEDWAGSDHAPGTLTHDEWLNYTGVEDFDHLRTSCTVTDESVRAAIPHEAAELDDLSEAIEDREPTDAEVRRIAELSDLIWSQADLQWVADLERIADKRSTAE